MQTKIIHNIGKHMFFICVLIFLFISNGNTQNEGQQVEITMKDGSTIVATIIKEKPKEWIVKNETIGEIIIKKSNVLSSRILRQTNKVEGVYWHENPNTTRNLYGPTGYGLRKGEGYYQNLMVFLNHFSYGFSDYFTLGLGVEVVSVLGSLNSFGGNDLFVPGFTLTPKFSFPIKEDQWNVGAGALALHIPYSDAFFSAGILYGVSTWGNRDNNFTLGLGFGVNENELTLRPTITISGNARVTRRFGLVTENWIIPLGEEYAALFSAGGRYIGNRISWDFALIGGIFDGFSGILPIPLVGITIPFGEGWSK